jgi:hypothetical protein
MSDAFDAWRAERIELPRERLARGLAPAAPHSRVKAMSTKHVCGWCEGWGCRRCRKDYGEQMPERRELDQVLDQLERQACAMVCLASTEQLLRMHGRPHG